ncbi:hypothetical protein Cni_G19815 [Canna indica]|uniref:PPC domain-containing protein n=1 Tax=Canna indica TaxID=4628 RepID=A0AAQ3QH95_9LILI|nr:hypothetical protein Cni_G19815 [Canna indica]
MAELDPDSASHFVHSLHLHLPHAKPDNEDSPGAGGDGGGDDQGGHGLDLSAPGDVVARRPRGRPLSSKNKMKPLVIITRESANAMRAHILEVGAGYNVFECLLTYTRCRQRGVCVLSDSTNS